LLQDRARTGLCVRVAQCASVRVSRVSRPCRYSRSRLSAVLGVTPLRVRSWLFIGSPFLFTRRLLGVACWHSCRSAPVQPLCCRGYRARGSDNLTVFE
jgi:hypothetical protein